MENEEQEIIIDKNDTKYYAAIGRRKTSIASVRIFTQGDKTIEVNGTNYKKYFASPDLQQIVESSLKKMKADDKFRVMAVVRGGGIHAQAEAIRHGIARALVVFNPEFKKRLRRASFLTRDSRMRERKKFGLKRARKAPQWAKR